MQWAEVAEEMASYEQSLCIVNLKRHALELFSELKELCDINLFHLSTNMCPAHRNKILDDVRKCLKDGSPCRLVATQCVEAGVDIDFPVVFRSWGPLDSLSQAAGRCNRNGIAATDISAYLFRKTNHTPMAHIDKRQELLEFCSRIV